MIIGTRGSKKIIIFLAGVFSGLMVMGAVAWFTTPSPLIMEYKSSMASEETFAPISKSASNRGWLNPKTYDIRIFLSQAFSHLGVSSTGDYGRLFDADFLLPI